MTDLNPDQFLYHGTATDIPGDKVLPAKVHGGHSHWGDVGSTRGEPANAHAWAHPDEEQTWKFAMDRVIHTSNEHEWSPRARVYAVRPNGKQSPGNDASIPGEVKAPAFDIAKRIDIMPGRQGTFPEINWNNHILHTGGLAENEDANHPKDSSVQFGHKHGTWGTHWNGPIVAEAKKEDDARYMQSLDDRNISGYRDNRDQPLPGMVNQRQFVGRKR